MKSRRPIRLALTAVALALAASAPAFTLSGQQYSSEAKLTVVQARQIASKTYPGQLVSEELEKEAGGSGLRYSFVILNKNGKHEVGVDAKTGAVLENSPEGKDSD